ncbi:MAG: response regulator transcription factor [Ethanoligenens sp.]|uniref:response regulator transcription factor n=1 Tax=Ethanoligenens sp. TaxID=2099655 RepID=UPI0039E979FE
MDRILIIDDDTEICMLLKDFLIKEGFDAYTLSNPEESFAFFKKCEPDLIILDILMPREDGLSVCQKIRAQSHAPIILASAKGSESDKVLGLGMGADDYIQKPFGLHELAARVKALLRRSRYIQAPTQGEETGCVQKGNFSVDTNAYVIAYKGEPLTLTMKEYRLLLFFIQHEKHVFDRETLYENIWGYDAAGDSRTVMVHIRKLRRKIEDDPDNPRHLLTIWGMGYKFVAEG